MLILELALEVGRNSSMSPAQQCQGILRTLLSRKNISYGSIWLKSGLLECTDVSRSYLRYCSVPNRLATSERLSSELLESIALQGGSHISFTGDQHFSQRFPRGVIIDIRGMGFLFLCSHNNAAFSKKEVSQILPVVEIFGISLENKVSQVQLKRSEALADHQRQEAENLRAVAETALVNAEKASESKSRFLTSMSHELRTPLNAILGFSDILLESNLESLSQKQSEYVNYIKLSGGQLLYLVNSVLDLSKVEAGVVDVVLESAYIDAIAEEAVVTARPKANEANIDIRINMADLRQGLVETDSKLLYLCVANLISNAIKYNSKSGTIDVVLRESDKEVTLTVRDTGIGIEAEHLDLIFESYERLNAAWSGVEGTGIGLTITRHLVEKLGGRITVESTVGVGSAFSIILPKKYK